MLWQRIRHHRHFAAIAVAAAIFTNLAEARGQGVRSFGVPPGRLPFRSFGNPHGEEALRVRFPEAAAAITGDDRSLARMQISRTDANGDGMVTQHEWTESGYQTPQRFPYYDLNGDGLLTLYEHSIGIARWRRRTEQRAEQQTEAQVAAAKKRNAPKASAAMLEEAPRIDPQVVARREQVQGLASYLLQQYDLNQNKTLERSEVHHRSTQFGDIAGADKDRDGEIDRHEITNWLHSRLPPLSRLNMELQARDLDHDDQVTFHEFSSIADGGSVDDFYRWDRNSDGFITPEESNLSTDPPRRYENQEAYVIKPGASVVSDTWIEDELLIDRLQVSVTITKEADSFTAIYLVSPSGRKVVLYSGNGWQPWRGALILKGVTFSDTAPLIRQTLNQPPFRRELRPPGKGTKDDPKLSSLRGESTRGIWRLIVRNQNDRVGLLTRWSITVIAMRARR